MIIFFEKLTGKIVGTIEGRVHPEDHLKMWIGDKDKTDRIICEWKPTIEREIIEIIEEPIFEEFIDDEGFTETRTIEIKKKKIRRMEYDYEPDHSQKDIFISLDNGNKHIKEFVIDIKTKQLKLRYN